ncbi:MAG TPA: MerR family transcriptional regulator [Kofleriaceae bacterium]
MRIGELAKRANVTPRTIRYYESIGLLPKPRRGNAQRTYDEVTVERLRKIDQLKALGLELDEIADVIELYFADPSHRAPKTKVLALLRAHLADVDHKLAELRSLRSDLAHHVKRFERWLAKS